MNNNVYVIVCFFCSILVIAMDIFKVTEFSSFDLRFAHVMFVLSVICIGSKLYGKYKTKSRE